MCHALRLGCILSMVWILTAMPVVADSSMAYTSEVLMVPPLGFKYNPETAVSNRYQVALKDSNLSAKVLSEFKHMVATLRQHGVDVLEFDKTAHFPDAVFPNNWFTTQVNAQGNTDVAVYPMLTPNRQAEVQPQALLNFLKQSGIKTQTLLDFRKHNRGALEGTGSMVLDRQHKIIYACLSDRTNPSMVRRAAKALGGYQTVLFNAYDTAHNPIYHTNVMMGLGHKIAVICLDCIENPKERANVVAHLKQTGKHIINIHQNQVAHMCGNVLELLNHEHHYLLVMSKQAYDHFTPAQRQLMARYDELLPVDIKTIETVGGGSARCMMAEIFHRANLASADLGH